MVIAKKAICKNNQILKEAASSLKQIWVSVKN
jgi:hypothetical protein